MDVQGLASARAPWHARAPERASGKSGADVLGLLGTPRSILNVSQATHPGRYRSGLHTHLHTLLQWGLNSLEVHPDAAGLEGESRSLEPKRMRWVKCCEGKR
jgi:hypothetical protein